jgi:hypothetical protein
LYRLKEGWLTGGEVGDENQSHFDLLSGGCGDHTFVSGIVPRGQRLSFRPGAHRPMLESSHQSAMKAAEIPDSSAVDLDPVKILAQLEAMLQDDVFRSSRRSSEFLKYVVTQALKGSEQIKERTIGAEVFGRSLSYDTNIDHIVRTAATELRKRLAIYYGEEKHRFELRIGLVPGSYVPRFMAPPEAEIPEADSAVDHSLNGKGGQQPGPELVAEGVARPRKAWAAPSRAWVLLLSTALALLLLAGVLGARWMEKPSPEALFWKPVLDTPGPVLLAVGDVPHGPPTLPALAGTAAQATPVPSADPNPTVPFADTVTLARVVGALESEQKRVFIRRESASSFSDLREGAVVLIGAFNNEWSLRLTHPLRYSLALDPDRNLVYIRDARNPAARIWSWGTNQPPDPARGINSPKLQDYALISRIESSETGHPVVVIGGLYTYGTEAAGEFLTSADLMEQVVRQAPRPGPRGTLQIVLGTTVTDGIPGPPRILAVSTE